MMQLAIVLFCLFGNMMAQDLDQAILLTDSSEDLEDADLSSVASRSLHPNLGYGYNTASSYYGTPQIYPMQSYGMSQGYYAPSYGSPYMHSVQSPYMSPSYGSYGAYRPSYGHPIHALKAYKKAMKKAIHGHF
ncbi:hypothetical protein QYM36_009117 [Artemia franciscana]|uniref:Uncharacterized protein n=1 Tax=Artemia franciscana TaxID=6661 RepID=A0AA88HMZ9_ARTSF|nr:hypothetical protein QYM36_009117 [Artemia franciscana]